MENNTAIQGEEYGTDKSASATHANNNHFLTNTFVVWFGAFICCALWGSAFPCIKIGYSLMGIPASDTAAQILYAGYRFTLAGILGILIGSIMNKGILLPKRSSLSKIMVLSLFQTILQYLFFYIGLANTSGVKASIIEGMNVFVALIIAGAMFHLEKITTKKLLGCCIGFAGVILVNFTSSGFDLSLTLTGEGFIFFSTIAYAFSSVVMKAYSKTENPVMLSGYQFVFGGIVMTLWGIFMGGSLGQFSPKALLMLLYLALVSAVAYTIWSLLLKYNPVSKVAVFGFMNPIIGVILSAILLKEGSALNAKSLLSLLLVCIGIFIVNNEERTPPVKD